MIIKIDIEDLIDGLINSQVERYDPEDYMEFEDWKDILDALLPVTVYTNEEITLDVEDLDDDLFDEVVKEVQKLTKKDIEDINQQIIDAIEDYNYRLHWSKL